MKRYTELTKEQKIALTDADFEHAVKLEAIERGVAPPITLSEALKRSEFRGFQRPADTVSFYELCSPEQYSGQIKGTGVCYRTTDEAKTALEGVVFVDEEGYGPTKRNTVREGGWSVREVFVSLSKAGFAASRLEEFRSETKEYDAIGKECADDLSSIHQREYDTRVNAEKRAQYLALAQGNEEIAKAFWRKAERSEWGEAAAPTIPAAPEEPEAEDTNLF